MWPNLYRIITFDYIPVFCKIFFGNVVTEHAWSQVLLWSLSQGYSAGVRDSMPSLSQRVSPENGLSQRVLEFFPVPQFTLCKGKTWFWLLWILFWPCNWTVVISIQIIIIQMVSWPTKRFLLFYVTWCHFVYFTFWVTYQPISLPPHDNKNLFPPHWFQHQDTHFSSLFTPSQHWWNLRVSDEIFVLFLLLRALELSVLKVYLQFYHRPCFLSCSAHLL